MIVWIINPYGNLPGEGWSTYRSTFIGEALGGAGHSVIWWISDFQHRSKVRRTFSDSRKKLSPGFEAHILPSRPYSAHISLGRVRFERSFARALVQEVAAEPVPDMIILAEPAICYADYVHRLLDLTGAALVIDIIDLWPELFVFKLPRAARWAGRLLLFALFRRRASLYRRAEGLLAVSRDYLELGLRLAPAIPAKVVYWGMEPQRKPMLVPGMPVKSPREVWVAYAGTLGENYDISSVLRAAALLKDKEPVIRFFIAGAGPLADFIKQQINKECLTNVQFLGPLTAGQVISLFLECDLGLCTYCEGSTVSMPIKAYDYLGAGLPIITSLGRDLGRFIAEEGIGAHYRPGDAFDLAKVVADLAEDAGRRAVLKANCQRLAPRLHPAVQYPKVDCVLREVQNRRRNETNNVLPHVAHPI